GAAVTAGGPVVVNRTEGPSLQWVFGVDLQAAAVALERTTQHGKQHSIYDRATACGLERVFRVLANAMVGAAPPRPADLPRLRAELTTDREVVNPGDPVVVRVQVRDAEGKPAAAAVRVTAPGPEYFLGNAGHQPQWVAATAVGPGLYEAKTAVPEELAAPTDWARGKTRQMRTALIYADVAAPGWVSDWVAQPVRLGETTNEPARMALLARLVSEDLVQRQLRVADKVQWVELSATLTAPRVLSAGKPMSLEVSIDQVEDDRGNDWAEDVELVLRPADGGDEVRLPLAPGKCFASSKASVVTKRPQDCTVVTSTTPARLRVVWPQPRPGRWTAALAYRYSDDYHIKDTDRLPRLDAFSGEPLAVK
ncbi:MAG: FixH family protein, partial [Armatimonadetes bacterium]|nr:FixH family protein [Armatimonadota bacterium]